MTKTDILIKLKELKPIYEKEGFIIKGLFGSYAREEEGTESDIDILYAVEPQKFCTLYPGFQSFGRLSELKEELKRIFNKQVDLAAIDNQSATFRMYALKDVIYV